VPNPADVPTKDKERRTKRDRIDCRKLARRLRAGEIEGIYVPCRKKLEDRSLVRTRQSMVRKQTRCKNQIKSLLLFYGIGLPEEWAERRWSGPFVKWLENLPMEKASGEVALRMHLEELKHPPEQDKFLSWGNLSSFAKKFFDLCGLSHCCLHFKSMNLLIIFFLLNIEQEGIFFAKSLAK